MPATAPPENEKAPAANRGAFQNKSSTYSQQLDHSESRRQLDAAKERVGISTAWHALGLPGKPGRACRSPFRSDRKPSLSITDDRLWKDHATGEAGDVVTFIQCAMHCSVAEAVDRLYEIAGGRAVPSAPPRQSAAQAEPPRKALTVPRLSSPSITDLVALQAIRSWPTFAGLELAHRRQNFFVATASDNGISRPAWALTDGARKSVQLRRLDGKPWDWCQAKAWTLGGSCAGWPIGCANIGALPFVAFCEGGPDFLAALTLAFLADIHHQVAAVFMPGAAASIVPEALLYFAGKRVRIFEHADNAGAAAGPRWAEQLTKAGAVVDGYNLDAPHKDLSDLLAATDAESLEPAFNIFAGLTEDSTCR